MSLRTVFMEDVNFLLTNRIPRLALTRFMGWFSKIENPLVRDFSPYGACSVTLILQTRRKCAFAACMRRSSARCARERGRSIPTPSS